MVVRMRHTRAHTANRRSHHALKGARFSKCANCSAMRLSHAACPSCGMYRGKMAVDVAAKAQKMAAKQKKQRAEGTTTESK